MSYIYTYLANHFSATESITIGLTPTFFKSLKDKRRNPLEDLGMEVFQQVNQATDGGR
ncbi:MAG: hypothetical protein ABI378_16260 [Chitinophagaceae bacterium]